MEQVSLRDLIVSQGRSQDLFHYWGNKEIEPFGGINGQPPFDPSAPSSFTVPTNGLS